MQVPGIQGFEHRGKWQGLQTSSGRASTLELAAPQLAQVQDTQRQGQLARHHLRQAKVLEVSWRVGRGV